MLRNETRPSSNLVFQAAVAASHILTPVVVATFYIVTSPLRNASVSWSQAAVAALFTTIIPWGMLLSARLRGVVSDLHVTQRQQRHWLYAVTAGSIIAGLLVLRLMNSGGAIYSEVGSILLGLAVVALINIWWKVSVHLAVGTFVALQFGDAIPELYPLIICFIALLSWARIKSNEHTASQVCGGVFVAVLVYYGSMAIAGGLS
ncbi:hypothetical protein AUR04nite_22160 [Glutamicibacter uratoxydans]|uniref:Phosphatidic acid phosphatase type 2/haloperoxidase domain-containing protein n=1 Tax=Glutamicibacter uratoxydans TaxID=43667 RepID=A0A4Y4DRZ9_GLUUR|nr:hypothetical protein AUR04nite_22160 [Glutamicibacter uratoxydans]